MKSFPFSLPITKKLIPSAALVAAGVTGLNYALRRLAQRPLPQINGSLTIQGLQKPVDIIRDKWGVPHIFAQNETDLFFAQGFVHAQDRLFQMDTNRRVGSGRLSELVGPPGLRVDRFARIFGWRRAAEVQIQGGDPNSREIADAYVDGINAFIALGQWPLEYTLLSFQPTPWKLEDSAAWGVVLAWGLAVNWDTELMRAMLVNQLGPQKAADLAPTYTDAYETILPDTDIGSRVAAAMIEACHEALDHLPIGTLSQGIGSNNWVVNGQHTATGRPILANDPHLPPIFPALWYENHLVGGRYNVTGFTSPGVPGIIIGHNEHIAWGITNAFPDVQDTYVEHFNPDDASLYEVNGQWTKAEVVTEIIHVRGRKPVVQTVRYTRHGPVISDLLPNEHRTLSLRWTSYEENNHIRAILESNRATDWDTFHHSMQYWGFPCQNIVYADVSGNIGYLMPGIVPIRPKGTGLVPVPGWTDDYEWSEWIPFAEMPLRYNPIEGIIVTANNQVVGSSYPYMLTGEWLPPYRARRILELIDELTPLTMADNVRIQMDTVSIMARRFVPLVLPHIEPYLLDKTTYAQAYTYFATWNYDMHANSVGASIYSGLLIHFIRAVTEQAVGQELANKLLGKEVIKDFSGNPFPRMAHELMIRWLESGTPDWVDDIRPLVYPSYVKTIKLLRRRLGFNPANWQWGKLHQVNLQHQLARVPGVGRLWKSHKLPIGGDGFTINQGDVPFGFPPKPAHIIPSCRMILDVGQWDNSLAVLPGGQSGHLASHHYTDGVADWHNGRYHPMLFSRAAIETAVEGTLHLLPGHNR